jgi:beta-glucosidase/6-phospho-beta-glucosidase/beta-galactosidase
VTTPFTHGTLTWALGIEDTCVYPPSRYQAFVLDEHALTGHDDRWRDDLRAARDLGATAIRYGAAWPLANPGPGRYDWAQLDERRGYAAGELGLTVVADLVHYGAPTWLEGSFADPRYPQAVADFAGAFAARYRGLVDCGTPLNEPLTTASFAGLRGIWPPALTGWRGWTEVVVNNADGIARSSAAVAAANPAATMVHVEAASLYTPGAPEVRQAAERLSRLGFLPTDLVLGTVSPEHALYGWLVSQGADEERLERLAAQPARVDVLGINYYPDLSPRRLTASDVLSSGLAQEAHNLWTEGLETSVRAFADRYGLPMLITETSIEGDDVVRTSWLRSSVAAVRDLMAAGLDIRGYTWWPFFDFVDWSYASRGVNVEEFEVAAEVLAARQAAFADPGRVAKTPFLRRMGLVRLDEDDEGGLTLHPTRAAAEFAALSREGRSHRPMDETDASAPA